MTDYWTFLKPWQVELLDVVITDLRLCDLGYPDQVQFTWPANRLKSSMQKKIILKFNVDEAGRRNKLQLQRIREAIELFTLLSLVNNNAFRSFFPSMGKNPAYPTWNICLCGTLSPDDPGLDRSPTTWGSVLGFPDNLRDYSSDYQSAIQKLKVMGIEENGKKYICNKFTIEWEYAFPNFHFGCFSYEEGTLGMNTSSRSARWVDVEMHKMFESNVHPIAQLCLTRGATKRAQIYGVPPADDIPKPLIKRYMTVSVSELAEIVSIPELTSVLARTAASRLVVSDHRPTILPLRQSNMNQGFLWSTLLCGRSVCEVKDGIRKFPSITSRVRYGDFKLKCAQMSEPCFGAVCSAVADLDGINCELFYIHSVAGLWPWLAYVIFCGKSVIPSITCYGATLSRSDITAIAEVMKTRYPSPTPTSRSPEYDFLNIREGAEVWPLSLSGNHDISLVLSSECRVRARFVGGNEVEVVIPGYGMCKTVLGEHISRVSLDSEPVQHRSELACTTRKMKLGFHKVESASLIVDLLAMIGGNLRSLHLFNCRVFHNNDVSLDLTALSSVCPQLEELYTLRVDIVVSDHNDALRVWPLKTLTFLETNTLSGVVSCLENPDLRLTQELEEIIMSKKPPHGRSFGEVELMKLKSHHGEYLPVGRKKFPIELKIAMINVVINAKPGKAVSRLDANILSLIFGFASSFAQRVVEQR